MPTANRYNLFSQRRDAALHVPPACIQGTLKGWSMEKWFCWGAMGASGFFLLLFVLDLILGIPFGRVDWVVNIIGILGCAAVGYLGWDSFQELR